MHLPIRDTHVQTEIPAGARSLDTLNDRLFQVAHESVYNLRYTKLRGTLSPKYIGPAFPDLDVMLMSRVEVAIRIKDGALHGRECRTKGKSTRR